MTAQVVQLASPGAVDKAYREYCDHMLMAETDRRLLTDRAWMERRAVLNRRFDRLFLMQDATR